MIFGLVASFAPYADVVTFFIVLPTVIGTYYQAFQTRQEAKSEREGRLHSQNCLEFVSGDGDCINLVPLETLHSLPKAGDVVLLPGDGMLSGRDTFVIGAYLVESVEHIYTQVVSRGSRPREARLTKAVAKVTSLNPMLQM